MPSDEAVVEHLNNREKEILTLIANGLSNRDISQRIHISVDTVKWYNKAIFGKLGVSSRTQAVSRANELGLFENASPQPHHVGFLPARLTSFVGRTREASEILELLKVCRLVTLTGPGGTGKTRLALETGRASAALYQDGVYLVELAGVSEPWLVPNAITNSLKVVVQAGEQPLTSILRFLNHKQLLLILDNFEHILAAAPLVIDILSAAPGVIVLATSRERLNVSAEQEYPVEPLSLTGVRSEISLKELMESEAVDLFLQRAREVKPGLTMKEKDVEPLVQICQRLDGLPLALELAASQVKYLTLERLAERLAESLSILPEGRRDLPDRQKTLQSTIEWSYNLLNEPERIMFENLSIFRGGGTLEAIEKVCLPGEKTRTLAVLRSLVDKNLVRTREGEDGELRFYMLETIREFACELLSNGPRTYELRKQHAAYYTELTEAAAREFRTERQEYWLQRGRAEQDNLRSVLAWSLHGEELEYGFRMVAALSTYWFYSGSSGEGERWLDLAMTQLEAAPPKLQAAMLKSAGMIAYGNNELDWSEKYHQKALDLENGLGDDREIAYSKLFLAIAFVGNREKYMEALNLAQEGLAMMQRLEEGPGISQALNILGELTRVAGEFEEAKRYYKEGLRTAEETGEILRIAMLNENLGLIAWHQEDPETALMHLWKSMGIYTSLNNQYGMADNQALLAGPFFSLGQVETAALMLGAGRGMMDRIGATYQPADQVEVDTITDSVREKLGSEEYDRLWKMGYGMGKKEASAPAIGFQTEVNELK